MAVLITITLLLSTALAETMLSAEPLALSYTGHPLLWQTDPNLTGEGTVIGTVSRSLTYTNDTPQRDYRFNMNHESLYDADVVFMDGTDGGFGTSEHETAIAGILLGVDEKGNYPGIGLFRYRGVCPDTSVNAYEFTDFTTQNLLAGRSIPEDIVVLSLGQMFEYWWVRALEQAAAKQDFLVVSSNGNGRDAGTPMPLFPAAGSNVLSVGVIDSALDAYGNFSRQNFSTPKLTNSSAGPTEDRRCKPDIVAPGTALVPLAQDNTGYVLRANWSSLSAPIVAGTAALLHQKGTTDPDLQKSFDRPGKSLVLKAVLMNSARKLPFWHKGQIDPDDDYITPLDYTQGAGALDAMAAYEQLAAGLQIPGNVKSSGWDNRVLQADNLEYEYSLNIAEPNQMITVTLCWNRVYQNQYPFEHRLDKDTDLRLELWGIDPNTPNNEILLDYSDSINDNVEHIYFAADPTYDSYTIRVRFSPDQTDNPALKQRYALAWSVGSDKQIGNYWWYDLNEDNIVNPTDEVIYTLINSDLIYKTEMLSLLESLNVSDERLQLLTQDWSEWKAYLSDWEK